VWKSLPDWRRQKISQFFGAEGKTHHHPRRPQQPEKSFQARRMTAEEAQLAIFQSMSGYVDSYLIHPESMLGRIDRNTRKFTSLAQLNARLNKMYADIMLHLLLPKSDGFHIEDTYGRFNCILTYPVARPTS